MFKVGDRVSYGEYKGTVVNTESNDFVYVVWDDLPSKSWHRPMSLTLIEDDKVDNVTELLTRLYKDEEVAQKRPSISLEVASYNNPDHIITINLRGTIRLAGNLSEGTIGTLEFDGPKPHLIPSVSILYVDLKPFLKFFRVDP